MKFIISFLVTTSVWAAPIQLFHESNHESANTVKQIFIGDYQIPEDLIAIKEIENCGSLVKRGKLDLCLKNNGDLYLVSVDRDFINESLKVFQAP